jgi:ACS family glucarate transporter-like MFS transporter
LAKRYLLIVGTFLLAMLLYVDRVCISAAEGAIRDDLGFSETQMGLVFSAFALGYALFQTPSGVLADRLGPRRVLAAVVVLWSLFTALTGAVHRLWSMVAVRFLFGAGEAGAFPGIARAVYSWIPMSERGFVQGINFSATRLGGAIAYPAVVGLVVAVGWRASFLVLGVVGIAWAGAWYLWARDDPAEHPRITEEERAYILANRQRAADPGAAAPRPIAGEALRSRTMWILMGQYFASNFTFFFCISWMLSYLVERFGIGREEASWYATAPLLAGMVGNWVGGALVDAIYRRGHWVASRRVPAMLGFGLASLGMLASLATDRVELAVACLALAIFGADMTLSPSWSTCIDIGRRHSGAISGTMNMAGNFGSFLMPLAFPILRGWTGSAAPFFVLAATLNVLAIVGWGFTRPDRPLEEERRPQE